LDSVIHLEDYLKILEKQGFKEVLKVPFVGRRWENLQWKAQDDLYLVYWRSPVIVAFDTFSMKLVNGGCVWYNWKPYQKDPKFCIEMSYWLNDVLIGCHDCRVDFVRTLDMMGENGMFINPWINHNLWLVNYVERYQGKDEEITINRFNQLPQEVKECVANGICKKKEIQSKEVSTNAPDCENTS
jgi:hypothetical protein